MGILFIRSTIQENIAMQFYRQHIHALCWKMTKSLTVVQCSYRKFLKYLWPFFNIMPEKVKEP